MTDVRSFPQLGTLTGPVDDSVPYSAEARESSARNERAAYYAAQPTARWPLGMRTSLLRWPVKKFDTALNEDTLAWRTIRRLAPGDRGDAFQSHQHHMFLTAAMGVFSIPGYYQRILELGNYPIGNNTAAEYPFLTDNITHSQVAAWFAMHGLATTGEHIGLVESFFCSRRHATNRNAQTSLAIFNDAMFPRRPEDIETVVGIPQWSQLRFDAVVPGRVTDYSQTPGAPVNVAADPPMVIDAPGSVVPAPSVPVIADVPVVPTPPVDSNIDVSSTTDAVEPRVDAD